MSRAREVYHSRSDAVPGPRAVAGQCPHLRARPHSRRLGLAPELPEPGSAGARRRRPFDTDPAQRRPARVRQALIFEWLTLQATELTDPTLPGADPKTGREPALADPAACSGLRVEYVALPEHAPLPDELLAAVSFGTRTRAGPASGNALGIQVRLDPLAASSSKPGSKPAVPAELWWAHGPVSHGQAGPIRYAHDAHHLFALLELDEREHGGIEQAATLAYSSMRQFQQQAAFPHLLRVWNYMDAINEGSGDLERYRHFCVGRARGMGQAIVDQYPAATAIGHQHRTHVLQVYWLAGRLPGTQIENPRQVSAYRYPRAHGPVSPSFARATFSPDGTLLISGTASIVGHASQHDDDFVAQLDETVRNLSTLKNYADTAAQARPAPAGATANARGLFKVYVRDGAHAAQIAERLRQNPPQYFHPGDVIYLAADICRRELLLEIECVRLPAGT